MLENLTLAVKVLVHNHICLLEKTSQRCIAQDDARIEFICV